MLVFCTSCGKHISDRVAACPFCRAARSDGGLPAGGALSSAAPPRPIWNPNAACNWSLLLSPAFGAYIHALNWMTLNEPARARSAKAWFYVSLLMTGIFGLLSVVGVDKQALRYLALLYLVIWYFAAGRPQARYVKERYGTDYPRRPWGKPLVIAVAAFVAFFILVLVLVVMTLVGAGLVRRG
jgi:uncharacterized protein YhhL (DUF1145 family)